jgi:hypothetical protein
MYNPSVRQTVTQPSQSVMVVVDAASMTSRERYFQIASKQHDQPAVALSTTGSLHEPQESIPSPGDDELLWNVELKLMQNANWNVELRLSTYFTHRC